MADIGFADNVRETFSSTGTTITLAGAVDTFRTVSSAGVTNGDTIYLAARKGSDFSFGKFTWNTGGTLTQTTVFYSTNGNAAVSFTGGTGEVISDVPAILLLVLAYMAYASSVVSVGPNRATNPTLQLDFATASSATGLKIIAAAAAAGVSLVVISSGTNENLKIDAKGSGTVTINGTGTGNIVLSRAINYGGVTLSNAVTGTGNMVLSAAPTISGLLTVSGGQIAFPATQNPSAGANTLDDYEEGTWTPSIGGTATYTAQGATYTKIGRLVYLYCHLTINAIGSGSTGQITGAPFAAAQTAAPGSVGFFSGSVTNVSFISCYITSSTIDIVGTAAVGTATTDPFVFFQNGAQIFFSVIYEV